jgi:hypothetical protein
MLQRPRAVIVDVGDEAKLAVRLQHPRHRGNRRVLHEAPLPVPPLRPGVGMDQIDPRQRARRRPGQQFGGIAGKQPDVADVMGFDLRQDLRHAVDVGLASDEARVRKGARFGDQMLAAAKPDLEPDLARRRVEQARKVGRARSGDIQRKPRQQVFDQIGLMQPKLVALAPSEERTVRTRGFAVAGRPVLVGLIARTHRSV